MRQLVILFGYPTNGVLSLNNRVYRYTQVTDDGRDTTFYNRDAFRRDRANEFARDLTLAMAAAKTDPARAPKAPLPGEPDANKPDQ